MKKILIVVWCGLILFGCKGKSRSTGADSAPDSKRATGRTDSLNALVARLDNDMTAIDRENSLERIDSYLLNLQHEGTVLKQQGDTLRIALYSRSNTARKLEYSLFGEDERTTEGVGYYYFDSSGRLFASRYSDTIEEQVNQHITIFLGSHQKEDYTKVGDKITLGTKSEAAIVPYFVADAVKQVDDLMQVFPNVRFSTPKVEPSSGLGLFTLTAISLFADSTSKSSKIKSLPYGSKLFYLGSSRLPEMISGQSWLWYKVKAPHGAVGWVFGHPEYIHDLNDEYYP
jgi:hypothetical protein